MKKYIPIVLSSDDNYSPFIAVTIASACYTTKEHLKFYIFDSGISDLHKQQIISLKKSFSNFDIDFIAIEDSNFAHLPSCQGFPLAMYSRLLIPQLCQESRVLYSDVDVIFMNDIAEFYNQDIAGYALGGIFHAHYVEKISMQKSAYTTLGIPLEHKYFYGGNLLIDCDAWRKRDISRQLIEVARKHAQALRLGDQDVLNIFFACNYKQLDYKFCLTTQDCEFFKRTDKNEYQRLVKEVVVRHFETRRKPWLTNIYTATKDIDHFQDFWFFASLTPFYSGLQQVFLSSILKDKPQEIIGNISINNEKLKQLRASIKKNI